MLLIRKITKYHQKLLVSNLTLVGFSVLVLSWQNSTIPAKEENDIHYRFSQTDSSYTFYGSFEINADPKCLLEITFKYEHIAALASDAREVTLIEQGRNWNQIRYTYRKYVIFENSTAWHRKLDEENLRVDFSLLWSENNQSIMPRIISSSGYYQIIPGGDPIIVEYFQYCRLTEEPITQFYLDRVKKEAIDFMHHFAAYALEHCKSSSSNPGT